MYAAQNCYDVAVYLIDLGCEVDKLKFLFAACLCGKVDKIKELVVELSIDPNGEHMAKHNTLTYFWNNI